MQNKNDKWNQPSFIGNTFLAQFDFFICFKYQCGYQIDHHTGTFTYANGSRIFFFLAPINIIFGL